MDEFDTHSDQLALCMFPIITNVLILIGILWGFFRTRHLFLMALIDPAVDENFGGLISGYVLEDGEMHGLVEITGRSERSGMYAMSTILEVVDVRGRQYEITGATMNAGPLGPWPAVVNHSLSNRVFLVFALITFSNVDS